MTKSNHHLSELISCTCGLRMWVIDRPSWKQCPRCHASLAGRKDKSKAISVSSSERKSRSKTKAKADVGVETPLLERGMTQDEIAELRKQLILRGSAEYRDAFVELIKGDEGQRCDVQIAFDSPSATFRQCEQNRNRATYIAIRELLSVYGAAWPPKAGNLQDSTDSADVRQSPPDDTRRSATGSALARRQTESSPPVPGERVKFSGRLPSKAGNLQDSTDSADARLSPSEDTQRSSLGSALTRRQTGSNPPVLGERLNSSGGLARLPIPGEYARSLSWLATALRWRHARGKLDRRAQRLFNKEFFELDIERQKSVAIEEHVDLADRFTELV